MSDRLLWDTFPFSTQEGTRWRIHYMFDDALGPLSPGVKELIRETVKNLESEICITFTEIQNENEIDASKWLIRYHRDE